MKSVLIVSSSIKGQAFFEELLKDGSFQQITTANSSNEARRILIDHVFDLCIINAPLQDEFGTSLAQHIATNDLSQVMLTVKSELSDEISEKVENFGVFVISRPIHKQVFWSGIKLITAAHKKMTHLQNQNLELQNKIEDIRFINRAKYVLIQYLKMTEPQAHKYIERQAMDMRITKREVASSILKTYES